MVLKGSPGIVWWHFRASHELCQTATLMDSEWHLPAATMRWFSLEFLELNGILDPGFPFGVFLFMWFLYMLLMAIVIYKISNTTYNEWILDVIMWKENVLDSSINKAKVWNAIERTHLKGSLWGSNKQMIEQKRTNSKWSRRWWRLWRKKKV